MCDSDKRSHPQGQKSVSVIRAGFTLIEVMVVVVVLGLMASMVAPDVFRQLGQAKSESARSQIEMLGAALDSYRLDNNTYPTGSQGLESLRHEPLSGPDVRNWRGPYLRKDVPLDPWGNPYEYRSPGRDASGGYELISYGADGREGGTGDDMDLTNSF